MKNCRLVGLLDLNQASPTVRAKIVAYLNKLIDMGVAGFRHDASKHMWPQDILNILNDVKDLRSDVRYKSNTERLTDVSAFRIKSTSIRSSRGH